MNAEVLLQVDISSKDVDLITSNHKDVVDVDCKDDKADLYLLREHSGVYSVRGEAKVSE